MTGELLTLWSRFMADDPLSAADQRRLLELIGADPAARSDLREDLELHGLAGALGRGVMTAEAGRDLARAVQDRLRAERDGEAFATRVGARLRTVRRRRPGPLVVRRLAVGALGLSLVAAAALLVGRIARRGDHPRHAGKSPAGGARPGAPPRLVPSRAPAPADAPARVPGAPDGEPGAVVLAMDFEGPTPPRELATGEVVDGPGGRRCAIGGLGFDPWAGRTYSVGVREPDRTPLFTWTDDLHLEFSYWIGADATEVRVHFWNPVLRRSFQRRLATPTVERWTRVSLPLREVGALVAPPVANRVGDAIENLLFMGGRLGGPALYVDDVLVTRGAPAPR